MKLAFKILILFLIIFNFEFPVVYYSCTIGLILCVGYYFFYRKSIPFTYFSFRYIAVILIASVILAFITFVFRVVNDQPPLNDLLKRVILQTYMLLCMVFAMPIMFDDESNAFGDAMRVVCYAFALQGLIHLLGFLFTPIGDFIFSMKRPEFQDYVLNPANNIDKFRAYALSGSIFFELPAAYGVACIAFFRIQLMENKQIFGWRSYVIILLFIAGISLSGRTGFVGLFIGLALYILFTWKKWADYWKIAWKIALMLVVMVMTFYYVLTPKQRLSMNEELFPFAFEAYYNYRDYGTFSTASTDVLEESHYYPLKDETLLFGHGVTSRSTTFYRNTDAGYMEHIIFGGVFYLLCLIVFQALFFIRPLSIANSRMSGENRKDLIFFLFLFLYTFILEYKSMMMGTQHLTEVIFLYMGTAYIIRYYYRRAESIG